ncbi:MAG TPA: hypothetical protein VIT43_11000 [Candidatus Dormibacteraeota bacterium]
MSETLALKLVLTPVLIAGATLVGRRWGPSLSGWLVGLPFTSGPVVFFLGLEHGTGFAATAALGVVLGVTSQAVFGLAYIRIAVGRGWLPRVVWGTVAFAMATITFALIQMPEWLEPLLVAASLLLAIRFAGRPVPAFQVARAAEPADLSLRIVIATALVIALTETAPLLGARLSGLLSPFPLYAGILAVFAHRQGGAAAAHSVWRGLFFGLFAFLGFFTVLAATLGPIGIGGSFALAILTALLMQGLTLLLLRRLQVAPGETPVRQAKHPDQPGDYPDQVTHR